MLLTLPPQSPQLPRPNVYFKTYWKHWFSPLMMRNTWVCQVNYDPCSYECNFVYSLCVRMHVLSKRKHNNYFNKEKVILQWPSSQNLKSSLLSCLGGAHDNYHTLTKPYCFSMGFPTTNILTIVKKSSLKNLSANCWLTNSQQTADSGPTDFFQNRPPVGQQLYFTLR